MRQILTAFIALLLSACGGQVSARPLNICWQPTGELVVIANCDASIQTTLEADPVKSVAQQAQIPGTVILWLGRKQEWAQALANFPTMINEAKKYPGKFPWGNFYDEPGLCAWGVCEWPEEAQVAQAAAVARAAGIKSLITILPDVILEPRFRLIDINEFDGINIDVYPSMRPTSPNFGACRWSDNHTANLFYCSAQKLRAMGFRGQIGYTYQAFGIVGESYQARIAYLAEQRYVINNAWAMGADAVMAWGCHLGASDRAAEPNLEPLCGTQYEYLVTP